MGFVRFILALSVVLTHAGPVPVLGYMAGGPVAVQCFFILSGFYMSLVLNEKYSEVLPFYWNRFSRIYSGYWVALIAAVFIWLAANDNIYGRIITSELTAGAKALALTANTLIFGSDTAMFFDATPQGLTFTAHMAEITNSLHQFMLIPQAWSLPLELGFYLMAPFVVRSKARLIVLFVVSTAISFGTKSYFGPDDPWAYRFFPSELRWFALGALSYYLLPIARKLPKVTGWAALTAVLVWICGIELMPYNAQILIFTVVAVSSPFILASIGGRVDRELGEASYMLYLIHVPILGLLQFNKIDSLPLVIALSIGAALILHQLALRLDRMFRSAIKNRSRKAPAAPTGEVSTPQETA